MSECKNTIVIKWPDQDNPSFACDGALITVKNMYQHLLDDYTPQYWEETKEALESFKLSLREALKNIVTDDDLDAKIIAYDHAFWEAVERKREVLVTSVEKEKEEVAMRWVGFMQGQSPSFPPNFSRN